MKEKHKLFINNIKIVNNINRYVDIQKHVECIRYNSRRSEMEPNHSCSAFSVLRGKCLHIQFLCAHRIENACRIQANSIRESKAAHIIRFVERCDDDPLDGKIRVCCVSHVWVAFVFSFSVLLLPPLPPPPLSSLLCLHFLLIVCGERYRG